MTLQQLNDLSQGFRTISGQLKGLRNVLDDMPEVFPEMDTRDELKSCAITLEMYLGGKAVQLEDAAAAAMV